MHDDSKNYNLSQLRSQLNLSYIKKHTYLNTLMIFSSRKIRPGSLHTIDLNVTVYVCPLIAATTVLPLLTIPTGVSI